MTLLIPKQCENFESFHFDAIVRSQLVQQFIQDIEVTQLSHLGPRVIQSTDDLLQNVCLPEKLYEYYNVMQHIRCKMVSEAIGVRYIYFKIVTQVFLKCVGMC